MPLPPSCSTPDLAPCHERCAMEDRVASWSRLSPRACSRHGPSAWTTPAGSGRAPPVASGLGRLPAVVVAERAGAAAAAASTRNGRLVGGDAGTPEVPIETMPTRSPASAMEHSVVKLRVSPARHERRPARRPLPPPPEPCDRRPRPDVAEAQLPEAACTCQDLRLYALMRGWRGRIDAIGRCCHGVPQRRRSRSR
jgi:hypothetical protein